MIWDNPCNNGPVAFPILKFVLVGQCFSYLSNFKKFRPTIFETPLKQVVTKIFTDRPKNRYFMNIIYV